MTSQGPDNKKCALSVIRWLIAGLAIFTMPGICVAQNETGFKDAILAKSSDMTKTCVSPPIVSAPRLGGSPTILSPTDPTSCTDIGSTYTLTVGGRLYGIKRSLGDVQKEAGQVSLGNSANTTAGVVANQPTGTHFMVSFMGTTMRIKLGSRESSYTVVFVR